MLIPVNSPYGTRCRNRTYKPFVLNEGGIPIPVNRASFGRGLSLSTQASIPRKLVPCEGLEPSRITPLASKTSVAANYTSRALFGGSCWILTNLSGVAILCLVTRP